MSRRNRSLAAALILATTTAAVALDAAPAAAATRTVDTTADVVNALDGVRSLREAVNESNFNDTIIVPAGTYALTCPTPGTPSPEDSNASGDLDIVRGITIRGAGSASTIITINPLCGERVMHLNAGDFAPMFIEDLTISGGREEADFGRGGGLRIGGPATTITNSVIEDNRAGPNGNGGGIDTIRPLTLDNVEMYDNHAGDATGNNSGGDGGGIHVSTIGSATATLTITDSIIGSVARPNTSGDGSNDGGAGSGGGIHMDASGALTLTRTVVDGNRLGVGGNGSPGDVAAGGGVSTRAFTAGAGAATITDSTITNNVGGTDLLGGGGGAFLTNTTVNISGTTIEGNSNPIATEGSGGDGGGLAITPGFGSDPIDVTLTGNTIRNNSIATPGDILSGFGPGGGNGGGVFIEADSGTATLTDNVFDGNTAGDSGSSGDSTSAAPGSGGNLFVNLFTSTTNPTPGTISVQGGEIVNGIGGGGPNNAPGQGGGAFLQAGVQNTGGTITVRDVDVTGNETRATQSGGQGGGIYARSFSNSVAGSVVIDDVRASGNTTAAGSTGTSGGGGAGGALYLSASGTTSGQAVTIDDSTFDGNETGRGADNAAGIAGWAGNGGGVNIVAATVSVSGSAFTDNATGRGGDSPSSAGRGGAGGGLYTSGAAATITSSTFTGNTTGIGGSSAAASGGLGGNGGGLRVDSSDATSIIGSTISGNTAGDGGTGATFGGSGGNGGGFSIDVSVADAPVSISDSTISNNTAGDGAIGGSQRSGIGGNGGGAEIKTDGGDITLDAATIDANQAGHGADGVTAPGSGASGGFGGDGGGIHIDDSSHESSVTVNESTISNNTAGDAGESLNDTAGVAGDGGGLHVAIADFAPNPPGVGQVSVERSTIAANTAGEGASGTTSTSGGAGGGAYIRAGDGTGTDVTFTRSTIDSNAGGPAGTGNNAGDGGGIFLADGAGQAAFNHMTLTNNDGLNGVNLLTRAGQTTISGTVIGDKAGQDLENCNAIGVTLASLGHNLEASEGGFTCEFDTATDIEAESTDLGPFGNNGGPTQTRVPISNGALIDVVPCSATTDQRGAAAPSGDACDIGAVESSGGTISIADATVSERVGVAEIAVKRTSGTDAYAVTLTTTEGTALDGLDFEPTTATISWAAGEIGDRTFSVPIIANEFVEDDETFTVSGAGESATVTIVDVVDVVDLIVPTAPARFVDTRSTGETVDGDFEGIGKRTAASEYTVQIAGRDEVPSDAAGVVMNVTAVGAEGTGFVTVHPCLDTPPNASSLNYTAGTNLGNEIIAGLDADGQTCLFTSAAAHLTVDVVGYVPNASPLTAVSPARILETRDGDDLDTVDDEFEGDGKTEPNSITKLTVAGRAGVPSDSAAVIINLTAVGVQSNGFVTVYPCTPNVPLAASLNYTNGINRGNELIAQLDSDGELCIFTSSSIHITVDLVAHIPAGSTLTSIDPARLLDTRDTSKRTAGSEIEVQVTGRAGISEGASAVIVNVTAVQPDGTGFVTVHRCLADRPNASALNYVANVNGGNEIVAQLSTDGTICLFISESTHLTVDAVGALD